MRPKIVFLDEYSLGGRDLTPLRRLGEYTGYDHTDAGEVASRCADAEIVISNKVPVTREAMSHMPRLRMIAVAATGMNNIDLDAAADMGVEVRNAVGYSTHSVAEATLSAALSLLRQTVYYDDYFKDGEYASTERIFNFGRPIGQLYGHRWGIIGLGNIGREVARLAEAFGCLVSYHSTSGVKRQERWPEMSLGELLAGSDVVSIHAPLNDATRGLIGRTQLKAMKQSAIIINVARGGIIDESALAEALDAKEIAGAALDVFSQEPLRESPLYGIRDHYMLLASPHTAWASGEAIDRLIECIVANISDYLGHNGRK